MLRLLSVMLCACALAVAPATAAGPPDGPRVASLNTVLTDLARQVGGARIEVVEIVEAGVDPHLFEPTPGDIRRMADADLVLASGLGFEPYLDKLRQSIGAGPQLVVVGDFIENPLEGGACGGAGTADAHDHGHCNGHGAADPHWWHSIANARTAVRVVRDALTRADAGGGPAYIENANRVLRSLEELETWVRVQLAALPRERRVLVTSHHALGYFARDYGFELLPVYGVSSGEQPSSQHVRKLIDLMRARGIKAVFADSMENPRVLEEIMRETGAAIGGTLYTDGLGTDEAASYAAMMRHNVNTILAGLDRQ